MPGVEPDNYALLLLRDPGLALRLRPAQWTLAISDLRGTDLLSRVAAVCNEFGLLPQIPEGPRRHLEGALQLSRAQVTEVRRELRYLQDALTGLDGPVLVLKGAAYIVGGHAAALGRTFSDIDLLVPKPLLPAVESQLMLHGWMSTHHDPYDQRYYREWMHELPPMRHLQRGTSVDVHHAILPETAHLRPDSAALLADAQPVAEIPGWFTPSTQDLVLHSLTHLLHNDDLSHALRDLSDVDRLLRQHATHEAWWTGLLARAHQHQLPQVLFDGLRLTVEVLDSPVPAAVLRTLAGQSRRAGLADRLIQGPWRLVLRHGGCMRHARRVMTAEGLLYLRAHALRMPPGLLVRHLSIKAWRQLTERPEPVKA